MADESKETQAEETTETQETADTATSETTEETSTTSEDGKTFTQEELDAIISKRLKRERKQWDQQLEEEKRKAAMDETERLKAEKAEAEEKAQAAQEAANERLIKAEAKVQAAALGVKPERVEYALRLADLSEVEVGDDGEPDAKAIKAAVEQVIKDLPELKGTEAPARSGGEFNGSAGDLKLDKPFAEMTLEERQDLYRKDPDLYRKARDSASKG